MHCNLNSRAALTAGGEGGLQAPGATTNAEEADTTKEEHPNLMELITAHTKFENKLFGGRRHGQKSETRAGLITA